MMLDVGAAEALLVTHQIDPEMPSVYYMETISISSTVLMNAGSLSVTVTRGPQRDEKLAQRKRRFAG
jgi:hypothetical protein